LNPIAVVKAGLVVVLVEEEEGEEEEEGFVLSPRVGEGLYLAVACKRKKVEGG
jgi:hypothetical protein